LINIYLANSKKNRGMINSDRK